MEHERIIERLDAMIASGRITPEEAERVRASSGTPEFEEALGLIRARHARVHTEVAVAEGRMSQEEADASLEQVRRGEHSPRLRARIRGRD